MHRSDSQADYEDWLHPPCMSCCVGLNHQRRLRPCGLLCPLRPALGYAGCGANQLVIWCGLKVASGCVFSGFSLEGRPWRVISALPVSGLQLPGRCLKTICDWLLPVLDLEEYVGGLAMN